MKVSMVKGITILLVACCTASCNKKEQFVISNASDIDLVDALVIVDKASLSFLAPESLPVFCTNSNDTLISQLVDENEDGAWDHALLVTDLGANERKELIVVESTEDQYPRFPARTHVHLGYSKDRDDTFIPVTLHVRPVDHVAQSKPFLYQYEGPGWESEKVAFRSYFDSRNGKDIFGKTTPQLKTSSIGIDENYHTLQSWGMDVLKVGSSLGAGAIAMLKNDSLYRLGETESAQFNLLTNGPIKSVMSLSYNGWMVEESSYTLQEVISIEAGKRWYKSDLTLSGDVNAVDTLAVGIVDLKGAEKTTLEYEGWHILYTHGIQSENKDALGMALMVKSDCFIQFSEAPKEGDGVTDSYIALLKPSSGKYSYLFYSGWEGEEKGFVEQEFFEHELKSAIQQINQQVDIIIP